MALLLGACTAAPTTGAHDPVVRTTPAPAADTTAVPAAPAPAPVVTVTAPAPAPAPAAAAQQPPAGSPDGDPVGVWIAPDGSTAFILANGVCSGMYYNGGAPLDIGGGMTCAYSGNTLVVSQPPNQISYKVLYSGDTMTITNGSMSITFTRG